MTTPAQEHLALGDRARDRITGLTGIVVCISDWLNGCRRTSIQPESYDKDKGAPAELQTFDDNQLELVDAGVLDAIERQPWLRPVEDAPEAGRNRQPAYSGGPSIKPVRAPDPR